MNTVGVGSLSVASSRDYRSDQRDAQARLTRQRVIEAGTAVFLRCGYAAATMRAIATEASVAVPTVEVLFGRKSRLLKAAIDVAIAGDHEPVAVLDRSWSDAASAATSAAEFLTIMAGVLAPAQVRSAGLVLAVFEGAAADVELARLATQLVQQRAETARWLVGRLAKVTPLRTGCSHEEAVDTVWLLMDPAVFDRLTRQRRWPVQHYERWFADSVGRLLVDPTKHQPTSTQQGERHEQ